MGDMAEGWDYLKEESKQRRKSNTESSTQLLTERGIQFESKNGGAHLVVNAGTHLVDFWPSGGRWIARNATKTSSRGVFKLLDHIAKHT